jgi:hypothetical protein
MFASPAQQRAHRERPATAVIIHPPTKVEVESVPVFKRLTSAFKPEAAAESTQIVRSAIPPLNEKLFTFQPRVNHSPEMERALTTRGSFLTRVHGDMQTRAERKQQLLKESQPTFAPALSAGTQRKMARRQTSFLKRMDDDLKQREEHARVYRKQAHSIPIHVTFEPNIAGITGKPRPPPDFSEFLERAERDREDRRRAKAARDAMMAEKFRPERHSTDASPWESYPRRPQSARR